MILIGLDNTQKKKENWYRNSHNSKYLTLVLEVLMEHIRTDQEGYY